MKRRAYSILLLMLCLSIVLCSCNKKKDSQENSSVTAADDNAFYQSSNAESEEKDEFSSSPVEESEAVASDIVSEENSEQDETSDHENLSEDSAPTFSESKYYGMTTLNYVALGDSIARGYGLDNPRDNCYPALLAHALTTVLDGTKVNYTNYAEDGMTTQGLSELLNSGADAVDGADLITICIGANNLLGNFLDVVEKHMPSLVDSSGALNQDQAQSAAFIDAVNAIQQEVESEEFAQLMEEGIEQLKVDLVYIIDELKRRAPNADIVITTVYSPYNGIDLSLPYLGLDFDMGSISDRWVSAIDVEIVRIADEKNCVLVEAYEPFAKKGGLVNARLKLIPFDFNFDPHPNLKGHMELSNLHLAAIKNIK